MKRGLSPPCVGGGVRLESTKEQWRDNPSRTTADVVICRVV